MNIKITQFGRPMCSACREARENIMQVSRYVAYRYITLTGDVMSDGPAAAAEGDYYDVFDVLPVVIVEADGQVVRRWEGEAPSVDEIREVVDKA